MLVTRLQTVHGPNVTRHQKCQQWSHLSSSRCIFKCRNSTRWSMLRRRCGCQGRESLGWDCWHVLELAMQQTRCWWCPKYSNSGALSKFQHILTLLLALSRLTLGSAQLNVVTVVVYHLEHERNMNERKTNFRTCICTLRFRAWKRRSGRKSSEVLETYPDPRAILAVASLCWLPASRSTIGNARFECEIRLVCYWFLPIVI